MLAKFGLGKLVAPGVSKKFQNFDFFSNYSKSEIFSAVVGSAICV